MGHYEKRLVVMSAVRRYKDEKAIPDDPQHVDQICAELLEANGLDEVAVEWQRISKFEQEVRGGGWFEEN